MNGQIAQAAKEYTIQFGEIEQVREQSGNPAPKTLSKGILVVKIGSPIGSVVSLGSSEKQPGQQLSPVQVASAPRSLVQLLGRKEESKTALEALLHERSVEFYGPQGSGKTSLLKYLAHHPLITRAFPDGIVYRRLVRYQSVSDLLQILFKAFYVSGTPFKPTDGQIADALKNKKALILLDDSKLTAKEVKNLLDRLPGCTFLLASKERQLFGKGLSLELRGLQLNDSVSLIAQELGRTLNKNERADAEKVCTALKGNPLQIVQTVAQLQEKNLSLAEIAKQLESASFPDWTKQRLNSLLKPQKSILMLLAAFKGVGLTVDAIASLTQLCEVKSILETLLRLNLVEVENSRYSLKSALFESLPQKWNPTHFLEEAATYFKNWVKQHQEVPEGLLEESDAILEVLEWAVKVGRWSDVLYLGRAIEGVLALSGQWDTWELVLQRMVQAARATGDRAAKAFALHQLGTRSLCLDETAKARHYLTQTLHIRRKLLNDQVGAQTTSHNLKFLLLKLFLKSPSTPRAESSPKQISKPTNTRIPSLVKWGAAVFPLVLGGIFFYPEFSKISPIFSKLASIYPLNQNSVTSVAKTKETVTPNNSPGFQQRDRAVNVGGEERDLASVQTQINAPITTEQKSASLEIPPLENGSNLPLNSTKTNTSLGATNKNTSPKLNSSLPVLESIVLKPSSKTWGTKVQGTVTLSSPTPGGGIVVNLVSSAPDLAFVPSNVLVQAGETQASFEFSTSKQGGNEVAGSNLNITASLGETSKTISLKLDNPPPGIEALDLEAKGLTWGTTVRGTVNLDNPAPVGGIVVNLVSSIPDLAPVQPNVTIQAGEKSASFEFSTSSEGGNSVEGKALKITASYQETSKTEFLKLDRPLSTIQSLELNPNGVTWGKTVRGTVTLDNPAPVGGIAVNLISSAPDIAPVQPNVIIKAGEKQASFEFSIPPEGSNSSEASTLEITAFYEAGSKTTSLRVEPAQIPPQL